MAGTKKRKLKKAGVARLKEKKTVNGLFTGRLLQEKKYDKKRY
jgi:hypothetical protein